ncbi:hypothetical protein HGA64_05230 [Candidatus Falkowbacteria bacterium]|nr:hypothetical protein [Candidatus Falkowbacteria bacterium]
MNSKDLILDFIFYILFLGLVIVSLLLFINPGYFSAFTMFIKAMAPLFFFLGLLMIKLRWMSKDHKKRKQDGGDTDIVLRLSYFDKFMTEVLTFLLPMSISVIVALSSREYTVIDFIQAGLVFIIIYIWNKLLFSRRIN